MNEQMERDPIEQYRFDQQTGAYIIDVALDQYEEIFNEWDPSPYKRRDVDPDLMSYLEACSNDIPLDSTIEIVFRIIEPKRNEEKEALVMAGLRSYFDSSYQLEVGKLRELHSRTVWCIAAAFVFLAAAVGMKKIEAMQDMFFFMLLHEGITIGAWLFTWSTLSLFFFDSRTYRHDAKHWKRYSQSAIRFESA
ncbi:MAG: hypothetical protein ABIH86_02015 [Planctomycetota bacterium]